MWVTAEGGSVIYYLSEKGLLQNLQQARILYVEVAGEVGLAAVLDEPFDFAGDAALVHIPVELHQGFLRDGEGGLPAFAGGEEVLVEGPEGFPGGDDADRTCCR